MTITQAPCASAARWGPAARLEDVQSAGCLAVQLEGHTLALFSHDGRIYAVDNRCPHMGFPLHRGTVKDGILTCHWHHARFDLATGGTFDQWADDVRSFPVEVRDGEVWIDLSPRVDPVEHHLRRLRDGLERNISLVLGKSTVSLLDLGVDPAEPFRIGLKFGTHHRQAGWGSGLTTLTCLMNLLPSLDPEDRPRALFHGLSAVARDCSDAPPRFNIRPLSGACPNLGTLRRWFRQFIEVRDAEGAERCVVSALQSGASDRQIADMLFAAATDHRFIDTGHVLDFTNKALGALDIAGWEHAGPTLTSLVPAYANAARMEESNSWRNPVDLVSILERAFERLPDALGAGEGRRSSWAGNDEIVGVLLGEDPVAIVESLIGAFRDGATEVQLAGAVAHAAALRVARFHTSNEFGDWDSAHHTFSFANAVHHGLRRLLTPHDAPRERPEDTGPPLLLRGVFDAAVNVYLDRFLNVPPAPLPEPDATSVHPSELLAAFPDLLDRQQQVNEAGTLVAGYLAAGGDPDQLLALLGKLLLREDRDFHTIQHVEAAIHQYSLRRGTPSGTHMLIAAARYLAAHAPTMRSQGQTFRIAYRLSRGERLYEE